MVENYGLCVKAASALNLQISVDRVFWGFDTFNRCHWNDAEGTVIYNLDEPSTNVDTKNRRMCMIRSSMLELFFK